MTLTNWLQRANESAHAFGIRAGVNNATLSRFLAGLSGLSPTNIERITAATRGDVTFADLVAEGRRLRRARAKRDAQTAVEP